MENDEMGTQKVILFALGENTYGVPIDQVVSIVRPESATRVPDAPDFVEGVMNFRGSIIPVINVRKRFGMETAGATKDSRVIVVTSGDLTVGMLVDTAREVVEFGTRQIEQAPDIVGGLDAAFIRGIASLDDDRLLILLNLEKVLSDQDVHDLKSLKD
ncbi:chemotaxis protein CheW [Sporolactobacillus vineae]|uniref:chemotaxis protein CheW n=1 Tax=Sporolactobacillus vineae TaxID=444463 RepID=UPI000287D294|nr:chemotaxis protein CheW [Sporolactobacillus vineae]